MTQHLLSLLIFLPLIASVVVLFIPSHKVFFFRSITLGVNVIQLVVAILIYVQFDNLLKGVHLQSEFQYVERTDWISLDLGGLGKLSIDYFIGVDGLSVLMVLLSAL